MVKVTYHNIRGALGTLIIKRKNWTPNGANLHDRLAKVEAHMHFRTEKAVALAAKKHRPTKPIKGYVSYEYPTETKQFKDMGIKRNNLKWKRKPWKVMNDKTVEQFLKSMGVLK